MNKKQNKELNKILEKEKEFNLSDKIVNMTDIKRLVKANELIGDKVECNFIVDGNVKEAIRRLKEEFKCGTEEAVHLGNGDLDRVIDKIFGDKLI